MVSLVGCDCVGNVEAKTEVVVDADAALLAALAATMPVLALRCEKELASVLVPVLVSIFKPVSVDSQLLQAPLSIPLVLTPLSTTLPPRAADLASTPAVAALVLEESSAKAVEMTRSISDSTTEDAETRTGADTGTGIES